MRQSIPPAPSPPSPQGHCGAFARHVSPGGGVFANFALPGGWEFANPEATHKLLTRTRFLLEKKQIGSSVKDRNKLKRVVNACARFLCMHFFIAYQARIT